MGYSISARCRNAQLQKCMTEFMEKNYRGWSEVSGIQKDDYSRFASNSYDKGSTLSYEHAKLAVGFDYNACEPERDYIFAVTRWMALKVGSIKKYKDIGSVPFYVYDGGGEPDSYMPILVRDIWENKIPERRRWCLTSVLGFKTMKDKYVGTPLYEDYEKKGKLEEFYKKHLGFLFEYIKGGPDALDKLIREELERLNNLWEVSCESKRNCG